MNVKWKLHLIIAVLIWRFVKHHVIIGTPLEILKTKIQDKIFKHGMIYAIYPAMKFIKNAIKIKKCGGWWVCVIKIGSDAIIFVQAKIIMLLMGLIVRDLRITYVLLNATIKSGNVNQQSKSQRYNLSFKSLMALFVLIIALDGLIIKIKPQILINQS